MVRPIFNSGLQGVDYDNDDNDDNDDDDDDNDDNDDNDDENTCHDLLSNSSKPKLLGNEL